MTTIQAKDIRVGNIIDAPTLPKSYLFVVRTVTMTPKNNVIVTETNGRQWKFNANQKVSLHETIYLH